MDDTARYGLAFNPFLKNAKEVIVETREYKEATALPLTPSSKTRRRSSLKPGNIRKPGSGWTTFFPQRASDS